MAKIEFKGIDNYAKALETIREEMPGILGDAIYAAADIVADEIRKNISGIPVQAGKRKAREKSTGISAPAKGGMLSSLGIAKMQNDGGVYNVKIGFDGYNSVKTKKYPQGQPNAMIARSVEGGTSFRAAHPFVELAVRKTRKAAQQAMERILDEKTKKIMG